MQVQRLSELNELKVRHEIHQGNQENGSFSSILHDRLLNQGVRFSKHAVRRISQREVEISEKTVSDLNQAVERAKAKGARDIVVIGSQNAFIVNIPNNLVVTTMNAGEMKENIFTNIDSAVLI